MGGRGAYYGGGGSYKNNGSGLPESTKFEDFTKGSLGNEAWENSLREAVDRSSRMVGISDQATIKLYTAPAKSEYNTSVYAFVKNGENTIYINKNMFKNEAGVTSSYNNDVKSGFHAKGTKVSDVLTHENGHITHNQVMNKLENANSFLGVKIRDKYEIPDVVVKRASQNVNSKYKTNMTAKQMSATISRYATTNSRETIAEAFADYYANGRNATPYSREIVNLIRRGLR